MSSNNNDNNNSNNNKNANEFTQIPKEAIVRPENEKPVKDEIRPEEMESKDEAEYEKLKAADHDMDSDDNPDWDPEV